MSLHRSVFLPFVYCGLLCFAADLIQAETENTRKIIGFVVDKEDKSVPDAVVRPNRLIREFESLQVVTDANGRFELDRPDQWLDGLLAQTQNGDRMGTVSLDGNPENGDELKITLLPARTITGTVIGTDDEPIADAFVLAVSSHSETVRTRTDTEGRFSFRFPDDTKMSAVVALKIGLGMDYIWTMETPANDEYRLFGLEGDPSRRKKSDGPFELRLEGIRPVRFKVVDEDGKPVEGIEVGPWYFAKEGRPQDLNIGTDLYRRVSNAEGVVVFDFFPAWQTLGVTFWAYENRDDVKKTMRRRFLQSRTHVKPESFDGENEIMLRRAATVRGTVRFPDGRPAVGWQFRAQGNPDQFEQCITDREGRYVVPAVPGSTVNLSVEQPRTPLGDKLEKDWACRPRRNIDIGEETVVTEDFVLEKGTKVSGTATAGNDRKPVEQGSILINPLTPEEAEEENPRRVECWWWAPIKNGRYEFYTVPGDYRLQCQHGKGETKQIKLEPGKELTVDFHVEETRRDKKKIEMLRGKIQTADDPPKPVAGAKITCQSFDHDFFETYRRGFQSDENGEFEIPVGSVSVYVQVLTADSKQGILAKVSPKEKNFVLIPKPLATIAGKMVHKDTQQPVAGRRIKCSIRIQGEGEESRYSMDGFPQIVLTDENGVYRFSDVPTGFDYTVSFIQMPRGEPETGQNHHGGTEGLGIVSPKPGEMTHRGTYEYEQRIDGWNEYDWCFRQSYGRFVENNSFEARYKILLDRCKRDGKNLLVVFAATEIFEGDVVSETYGPLPRKLMILMFDRRGGVFDVADRFYVMGIPTDARSRYEEPKRNEATGFVKRRGIDAAVLDEMTLCFFDADGKLLGTEPIDGISEYGSDDNKPAIEFKKDAVIELLKKYVPK